MASALLQQLIDAWHRIVLLFTGMTCNRLVDQRVDRCLNFLSSLYAQHGLAERIYMTSVRDSVETNSYVRVFVLSSRVNIKTEFGILNLKFDFEF